MVKQSLSQRKAAVDKLATPSHLTSIIVSARNEASNLPELLTLLNKFKNCEIIVADSASTDNTQAAAGPLCDQLIRIDLPGKGLAMRTAVKAASGHVLVFIDGDNSYSPAQVPKMIKLIEDGCDLVYGSRFLTDSICDIGWFRLLGNKLFRTYGRLVQGHTYDFLTGCFAIKAKTFKELYLVSTGYEIEAEIFKKAMLNKLQITEVPIAYTKNTTSKLRPLSDGFKILQTLFRGA